jgi:hypothetical protein
MWCMPRRLSVTLGSEDERVVAAFSAPSSLEHALLLAWAREHGIDAERIGSDASLIRILIHAGAEALSERILDLGYAELAATLSTIDHGEVREARRRYVERTERTHSA